LSGARQSKIYKSRSGTKNLVKGTWVCLTKCIFNPMNYKGCEVDVEMTDQSYHQKTVIANVSDETKSETEVWIVKIIT